MHHTTKQRGCPNQPLLHQRRLRSWTQEDVARELHTLCQYDLQASARGEINAKMIGSWERGEHMPNVYYQRKLCLLFGKSTEELGFVETTLTPKQLPVAFSSSTQQGASVILTTHQAIDFLYEHPDATPEQQLGAWLMMSAHNLAPLFNANWTPEAVLEALQVILKGVQAMSTISRRQLLQLGAATMTSGISIPTGKQVSFEERAQIHHAIGGSIEAGWKLFHTTGSEQVLAVGQAQLMLIQQSASVLYPSIQPVFYSGVYRLMGAALHFQGRYDEAYQIHQKAYITALEADDTWNMAQSRSWQAYGLKARGKYSDALQATKAALRLISHQNDRESIRLRARLFAFSAENAALLEDGDTVQTNLAASEELLEDLPGYHEEFDRISWLQQAGNCALSLKQHTVAAARLQQALDELPPQWTLRAASTAIALARALTHLKKLDEALVTAQKTLPMIQSLQSPVLTQEFTHYVRTELMKSLPNDHRCHTLVVESQRWKALV